ncbi:Gfo/Idh/MocA family protein [Microbacterium sp. 18062]|uniref:Gfo/Idh/MocA family protein n=1 Tax=Microbacterium sp. 18062 TaxID=2681410 RepID=UPI00135A95E7|nr:Gfo/Idh/MocA family oxidoreductase [Microbacterium sp. 18062]
MSGAVSTAVPAPARGPRDRVHPLRVAIVGTGMIARVHARAARAAGEQVLGVLGSSSSRSQETAQQWRLPRGYADLDALLRDAPDVVHICTPNALHADQVRTVIAAGSHVVCEKPLATTRAEATELAALAREAGVVAAVPFVYRYHPMVREVRARRGRGELGDILLAHGTYLQDWMLDPRSSSWRVDPARGGASRAFADIGSHWCDLVEFVSGEQLAAVSALTSIAHATRPAASAPSFAAPSDAAADPVAVTTEDIVTAIFRTARGVPVSLVVSQVSGGRKNRLWFELDGTRASAVFDQEDAETAWLAGVDGARILHRGEGEVSADQARLNHLPAGHAQGFGDAFDAFVADVYAAVRGESPEGLPTFDDGARAAGIVDAVLDSAASRSWVDIPCSTP